MKHLPSADLATPGLDVIYKTPYLAHMIEKYFRSLGVKRCNLSIIACGSNFDSIVLDIHFLVIN